MVDHLVYEEMLGPGRPIGLALSGKSSSISILANFTLDNVSQMIGTRLSQFIISLQIHPTVVSDPSRLLYECSPKIVM
jgi:hypothetical protein